MKSFITYGEERIRFTICFVPIVARRIAIHILPNGCVQVDAPEGTAIAEVLVAVRKRARWIWLRVQEYSARNRHVLPREYVSGESHFYLGKRYSLKVIVDKNAKSEVKLLGGRLEVRTLTKDKASIKKHLDKWYRSRAEEVFLRRLRECASNTSWLRHLPTMRLRKMRTQWGSCSPSGELLLNPQLVKAPRSCIDYVIFHEICHLKESNHSPAYYKLLGKYLPDYARRKQELDDLADALLND